MEYRSPLQDDYQEPSNNGPLHSRSFGGGRYAPYKPKVKQGRDSTPSSQEPSSSHRNSTQHKYTDQYKPAKYPKELNAMFGANKCKLCEVEMKSPIVAKMHYSGKQHQKKVKLYLENWSEKNGLPIPVEVPDVSTNNACKKSIFPEYCEICDLDTKDVNTQIHHYSGKTHRKNMRDPANAKKKKKRYETADPSGRFGIGSGFSVKAPETGNENKIKVGVSETPCTVTSQILLDHHLSSNDHKNELGKKSKVENKDFCEDCQVSFTSIHHYHDHMAGKQHKKRFKLQALVKNKCSM